MLSQHPLSHINYLFILFLRIVSNYWCATCIPRWLRQFQGSVVACVWSSEFSRIDNNRWSVFAGPAMNGRKNFSLHSSFTITTQRNIAVPNEAENLKQKIIIKSNFNFAKALEHYFYIYNKNVNTFETHIEGEEGERKVEFLRPQNKWKQCFYDRVFCLLACPLRRVGFAWLLYCDSVPHWIRIHLKYLKSCSPIKIKRKRWKLFYCLV